MENKKKDIRGINGSKNLELHRKDNISVKLKILKTCLVKLSINAEPIIIEELAKQTQISVSTLYRDPYKSLISKYREEEKINIGYNLRNEYIKVLKENKELKQKLKLMDEKYKRLKKEVYFTKEMVEKMF